MQGNLVVQQLGEPELLEVDSPCFSAAYRREQGRLAWGGRERGLEAVGKGQEELGEEGQGWTERGR